MCRTLDAVMLPRLDYDRGAGVLALGASVPIRTLAAGAKRELPPEFIPCQAGAHWRWDGVDFETTDAASCALRIRVAGRTLELSGSAHLAALLQTWRAQGAQPTITGLDGALEMRFGPGGEVGLSRWRRP